MFPMMFCSTDELTSPGTALLVRIDPPSLVIRIPLSFQVCFPNECTTLIDNMEKILKGLHSIEKTVYKKKEKQHREKKKEKMEKRRRVCPLTEETSSSHLNLKENQERYRCQFQSEDMIKRTKSLKMRCFAAYRHQLPKFTCLHM